MKNLFFVLVILNIFLNSCAGNDDDVQKIDQVINLYIKDVNGKDLLNTKLSGTYSNIQFLDLNSERAQAPISSFSLKKDIDTINYLEYVSGAVRLLKDSINPQNKSYQSDFIISLNQKIDSENTNVDLDTIKIEYTWTPTLFQVSKFYYNGEQKFTKMTGETNIITIIK